MDRSAVSSRVGTSCDFKRSMSCFLSAGGIAHGAPEGGQLGRQVCILEGADLAGVEGSEVGAREFAGGDLLEEGVRKDGTRGEGLDGEGPFVRVEAAVTRRELFATAGSSNWVSPWAATGLRNFVSTSFEQISLRSGAAP